MLTKIIHFTCDNNEQCKNFEKNVTNVMSEPQYGNIEYQLYDINEEKFKPLLDEYRIEVVPTTVFINEKNEVNKKVMGVIPSRDLKIYINYELKN